MNHVNNFGAPVVHEPSYDRVHLRVEVPIQKARHIDKAESQEYFSAQKSCDKQKGRKKDVRQSEVYSLEKSDQLLS